MSMASRVSVLGSTSEPGTEESIREKSKLFELGRRYSAEMMWKLENQGPLEVKVYGLSPTKNSKYGPNLRTWNEPLVVRRGRGIRPGGRGRMTSSTVSHFVTFLDLDLRRLD